MGNIVSYLEEFGHLTFKDMPFNEVDALVLSQFSYLKFEGLVPKVTDNKKAVSLAHIWSAMDEKVVFSDERYAKDNRFLFERMLKSARFYGMRCNYYTTILNEDVETQFCAITCYPEHTVPVVVFRGTDESFVGWREDFNMAFVRPVPGQRLATLYLNQIGEFLESEFFVCGHSKGGNFSVYSSMNATDEIQNRIGRIYTFDGPGFRPEILNSDDYNKIAERIEKYIPKSSLVGMILESHEDYMVVDSSSIGLLQHDPYTWKVEEASFIRKKHVKKGQLFMNETLNEWILNLNEEQLEVFVDTLFYILEGCNMKNLVEITKDWKTGINNMIHASKEVSEGTREEMREILGEFFKVLIERMRNL